MKPRVTIPLETAELLWRVLNDAREDMEGDLQTAALSTAAARSIRQRLLEYNCAAETICYSIERTKRAENVKVNNEPGAGKLIPFTRDTIPDKCVAYSPYGERLEFARADETFAVFFLVSAPGARVEVPYGTLLYRFRMEDGSNCGVTP